MTELILHMNNYSITEAITTYQTYPKILRSLGALSTLMSLELDWNHMNDSLYDVGMSNEKFFLFLHLEQIFNKELKS